MICSRCRAGFAALALALLLSSSVLPAFAQPPATEEAEPVDHGAGDIRLTILYDNYPGSEGLKADWGFSCLIEGLAQTILFDTGADAATLLANAAALGVDLKAVEALVLSHEHWDHTGGLSGFLEIRPGVKVYMLPSFPSELREAALAGGAAVVDVREPAVICEGAMSTGEMRRLMGMREQSLVLSTGRGLIVVTGCAHPGIVDIVARAKELTGRDVLAVLGGFHLLRHSDKALSGVISDLHELGAHFVGPSHCSGDRAIELFREAYGERFIEGGVGKVITVGDLTSAGQRPDGDG
jgi:7,8-dihydropterin-6-yl-methyl-4-(beta-D-ribofuranosyl)aminobenzene 5'-phosphate synthase